MQPKTAVLGVLAANTRAWKRRALGIGLLYMPGGRARRDRCRCIIHAATGRCIATYDICMHAYAYTHSTPGSRALGIGYITMYTIYIDRCRRIVYAATGGCITTHAHT